MAPLGAAVNVSYAGVDDNPGGIHDHGDMKQVAVYLSKEKRTEDIKKR